MRHKWVRCARGVTLADVVVVTAAGALIVPLLLAIVRDANQQAGVAKCLSNLWVTMRATSMYLEDYGNEFPFYTITSTGQMTTQGVCTWSFGGKTSSDYWLKEYSNGLYGCLAKFRPLNPYLLGGQVEPDVMQGTQIVKRTPVPPLECPADRFSYMRGFNYPGLEPPISTFDDVGTSFQWNLEAVSDLNWQGNTNPWWQGPGNWQQRGQRLIQDVLAGQAETFTFYLEGPMDWGLGGTDRLIQTVGNHGEFSKHSCGYLDGHADYIYRDTRGWCGPGWEAINVKWIRQFGATQMVRYTGSGTGLPSSLNKTCNPPGDGLASDEMNAGGTE
ncbi:MAG: hypothetical protein AB1601_14705 [Planctomycetota bacterium]